MRKYYYTDNIVFKIIMIDRRIFIMDKTKKKLGMAQKVVIGLIVGIIAGILVNVLGLGKSPLMTFVGFLGNVYLNALKVMIYPMIFCAVVIGITEVGNIVVTGKVALKSIIFFIVTTAIASIVAVLVPTITKLGVGSEIIIEQTEITSNMTGILDMLANMIPANPVAAFANGDVMQILVLAVIVGVAVLVVGKKADPVMSVIRSINDIAMTVIQFVVRFTPIGAGLLIMPIMAKNSMAAISDILGYVLTYYVVIILYVVIVYFGIIKAFGGKPLNFFKSTIPAIATAFATFSSTAALPVSTKCADDRGIRKEISSIVIPTGSTMNMNAGAIMLLMSIIFYCNILGMSLSVGQIITLVVANIFLSIGTPAIPNGGVATFTALVVMAGLPGGVMSLFIGAMSLCNTAAVNVLGDLVACEVFNLMEDKKQAAKA